MQRQSCGRWRCTMTVLADQNRRQEIQKLVEDALAPLQPPDYRLNVVDVVEDDGWQYVIVQPDKEGTRNYDYYDILAQAEAKLQDDQNLNVLLVPSVPG